MKRLNRCSFLPLLFIIVFFVTSTQNAFAQNNDLVNKPTLAWINLGYGPVGGNDISGLGLITNAHYNSRYGLFGLRFFKAGDTGYFGDMVPLSRALF